MEIKLNLYNMKIYLLLLISFLIIQPVFAKCEPKSFNLTKETDIMAKEILYTFVLNDLQMTPQEVENFAKIKPELVRAIKYDLNNDGEDEVIGIVYSTFYYGSSGYNLFILQKKGYKYENISSLQNIEPQEKIKILKSVTNGFCKIRLKSSYANKFKNYTIEYNDNSY